MGRCPTTRTSSSRRLPVVGSFGAKDRTLRGAAARLENTLTAAGVDHDVREYPDAGHSFLNQHNSALFKFTGKAIGGGYDPAAAADARRRIVLSSIATWTAR